MWVRILAATVVLVSLSKTLYCDCLLFTQEYKWVHARVEVDIVFEKGLRSTTVAHGCILPRELRKITGMIIGPVTRVLMYRVSLKNRKPKFSGTLLNNE